MYTILIKCDRCICSSINHTCWVTASIFATICSIPVVVRSRCASTCSRLYLGISTVSNSSSAIGPSPNRPRATSLPITSPVDLVISATCVTKFSCCLSRSEPPNSCKLFTLTWLSEFLGFCEPLCSKLPPR